MGLVWVTSTSCSGDCSSLLPALPTPTLAPSNLSSIPGKKILKCESSPVCCLRKIFCLPTAVMVKPYLFGMIYEILQTLTPNSKVPSCTLLSLTVWAQPRDFFLFFSTTTLPGASGLFHMLCLFLEHYHHCHHPSSQVWLHPTRPSVHLVVHFV